jgi:outer membrane protein insertion porin family
MKFFHKNPSLENSFQNQFILGAHYSYIYNTQLSDNIEAKYVRKKIKQSNFYFNGTIDISGNVPRAIQSVRFDGAEGPYTFFGQPYSQYVRPTIDFRYFYNLNKHSKIATRHQHRDWLCLWQLDRYALHQNNSQ